MQRSIELRELIKLSLNQHIAVSNFARLAATLRCPGIGEMSDVLSFSGVRGNFSRPAAPLGLQMLQCLASLRDIPAGAGHHKRAEGQIEVMRRFNNRISGAFIGTHLGLALSRCHLILSR
jgi:hypothetical protein